MTTKKKKLRGVSNVRAAVIHYTMTTDDGKKTDTVLSIPNWLMDDVKKSSATNGMSVHWQLLFIIDRYYNGYNGKFTSELVEAIKKRMAEKAKTEALVKKKK